MYFEIDDSHIISDSAIIFIGFTMFFFGGLSFTGDLADKYAIAASVSSFLFVIAEWLLITDKITGRRMLFHGLIFGGGIISLIFLPVLLEIYPGFIKEMGPVADMLTFFSLGYVLLLFGIKSLETKFIARQKDIKEKEKENDEKNQLKSHIQVLEEQIIRMKNEGT